MAVFATEEELVAAVGTRVGESDWMTVEQVRIQGFADATGDHQWIHLDAERAAAGPFGTTIAHGFLTLSLLPVLAGQAYEVPWRRMGVNYGLDKVRFPAPVPAGARVRALVDLLSADPVEGGLQLVSRVTVEVEGQPKPACVADWVTRAYH